MLSFNRLLVCAFVLLLSLAVLPAISQEADDEANNGVYTLPDKVVFNNAEGDKVFWIGPRDPSRSDLDIPASAMGTRAYTLEVQGTYCKIYVDSGCSPYPTTTTLNAVVAKWDNTIYPTDTALFGTPPYTKIEIRIREIDGAWGIGGYFSPGDPDAVYIDNDDLSSWGYEIMAHELQHLIHNSKDWNEDLWVDEGCADMAIHFCFGPTVGSLQSHLGSFESNPNNDLFQFDNAGYDYGSSYAFILYFWDHYGGNSSVTSLVANSANGKSGFDNILSSKGYSDRFDDLYEMWIVANWLDDTSIYNGSYGYHDQEVGVSTQASHSTYPVATQSGTVQRYGATYTRFWPGPGDTLRLTTGGNAIYEIILLGQNGNANDTYMLGGAGTYDIINVGLNYSSAVLVIGATADESFSYSAEFLDLVPPSTMAVVDPAIPNGENGWYISKPQVTLECNDPGAVVSYRVDGGTWLNYTGSIIQIDEGTHDLEFFGEDAASNKEVVHNLTLNVDFTPPETTLTLDPESPDGEDGYFISQPTAAIGAGPVDMVFYRMDGSANQTYTGPIMIPEGEHTIEYWSEDLAGNFDIVKSVSVKVDITPPDVLYTITPGDPNGQNGYYTASPQVELDFDTVNGTMGYYRLDSGSDIEYSGPVTLEDGVHWLEYWAKDPAGNLAVMENITIKVDTVSPVTTLATDPGEPSSGGWFNVTPIVNLTTHPDAFVYCSMDGGTFQKYIPNFQNDDATFFGLLLDKTGVQILSVYSQDLAGNKEPVRNFTFKIDTLAPEVEIHFNVQPRETGWFTSEPMVSFSTMDTDIMIYYRIGGEVREYKSEFMLLEGKTNITYWGVDPAGNKAPELTYSARVDATAPSARLWMLSDIFAGQTVLADGRNSSDATSGVVNYRYVWDDGSGTDWLDRSTQTHMFTEAGNYNVTLVVLDAAGLESDPAIVYVFAVEPPQVVDPDDDTADDDAADDDIADDDADTGTSANASGIAFWIILIILLVVVLVMIVAVLVVVLVVKRKSSEEEEEEDDYDDNGYEDDPWEDDGDDFEISDSVSSRSSGRDADYDDSEAPRGASGRRGRSSSDEFDLDDDDDYDDDDDDYDDDDLPLPPPPPRGRRRGPVSSRPPDDYTPPPPSGRRRGPVRGMPVPPPPPEDDWDDDDDGSDIDWE